MILDQKALAIFRFQTSFLIAVFLILFSGIDSPLLAEEQALEQLLQLFEKKALVSPEEAKIIKETMAKERKEQLRKEKEIEDQKKALAQWEQELKTREAALKEKETAIPAGEGTEVTSVSQAGSEAAGPQEAASPEGVPAVKKEASKSEIPLKTVFRDGFCLSSTDDDTFALCIGSLLQADYRYYDYNSQNPSKNKFDIRRARLRVSGHLTPRVDFKFLYEFQGTGSRNLLDAYGDVHAFPGVSFRVGQFKEPFSLEQVTPDENNVFAERSMGYYLTPQRDLGFMAHSSLWRDRIDYGVGLFNGDGMDDAVGGDRDDPQWTGRLVIAPLRDRGIPLGENLQFGGSLSYARVDRNNVEVHVKTTGLTSFFDVASAAKFNIIQTVDSLTRFGTELAWSYGPLALWGEYIHVRFQDITTSSAQFNTELEDYYMAFMWMITGEHPVFRRGVFQPVKPCRNLWEGGWGGLGLAFRYDRFSADKGVYDHLIYEGNSVRGAKAYTVALNWYLNPIIRLILDATRTDFSEPLLISRDALKGTSIYSDREFVFTSRFQLVF